MAGPHAPDVRAVDLRLGLFWRRQDAELSRQRGILHDLELRLALARETRVEPVRVRGVERRPLAAARRLKDDLARACEIDVRLDRLLAELEFSRRPYDAAVRPDPELRNRLAVALAGARRCRVVVNRHKRVERQYLAVRAEENGAFGMRTEAALVLYAADSERVAVDGLARQDALAHPARRAGEVELVDKGDVRDERLGVRPIAFDCAPTGEQRRKRDSPLDPFHHRYPHFLGCFQLKFS